MNPPSNSVEAKALAAGLGAALALLALAVVKDINPFVGGFGFGQDLPLNNEELAAALAQLPPPPPPPSEDELNGVMDADSVWFEEKSALATIFSIGDVSKSAWDSKWVTSYGGKDDPEDRCGYKPCAFTPKENPFYVALPYNDLEGASVKETAKLLPWFEEGTKTTMLKDRWVKVSSNGVTCFAQWEDAGPVETDDFDYVFGKANSPKNATGDGIAISPAVADCLAVDDGGSVTWQLVNEVDVEPGPWNTTVTN